MSNQQSDPIIQRMAMLLEEHGTASLRTGERRTATIANKMLREAADLAGVEITTSKGENCRVGTVK